MWCWHGSTYKKALELIAGQGSAMSQPEAGVWARDLAMNALHNHEAHTNSPTPKLREAYKLWLTLPKQKQA